MEIGVAVAHLLLLYSLSIRGQRGSLLPNMVQKPCKALKEAHPAPDRERFALRDADFHPRGSPLRRLRRWIKMRAQAGKPVKTSG
jgi:hypothetical protein